jgi:cell division protein FtsI (penicillin-binding protein 3)
MHGAYAIHRPVVNRRLVRDRDRRWARELGLIVAAAVPILLTLLTSIWLRSEVLSTGDRTGGASTAAGVGVSRQSGTRRAASDDRTAHGDAVAAAADLCRGAGVKGRLVLLVGILVLWMGAISVRLGQLQIEDHAEYLDRAKRQQQRVVDLDPPRGTIFDRNGRELAVSVEVESAYAVPDHVKDPAREARQLAHLLGVDRTRLERTLRRDREFVWVARKLDDPVAQKVRALHLPGIDFLRESKRYYPARELAAAVLGYVGTDNKGLGGVEAAYDKVIAGTRGRQTVLRDARRGTAVSPNLAAIAPQSGADLTLTLDAAIQYVAERELDRTVRKERARGGTVVVLDVTNGAILAMASAPGFDPNRFAAFPQSSWRNRAVMDAYEPGSTFKMVTVAAALENNLLDPSDTFDCEMGSITLVGHRIRDHRPFGVLTVQQIIQKSSNVGAIKIGLVDGPQRLYKAIEAFGFGKLTGVDLPGETPGLLRPVAAWRPLTTAYIAFGQGLSVSPLQLASAFGAVANGGTLYRPYVVEAIRTEEGVRRRRAPQILGHPIDAATARVPAIASRARRALPRRRCPVRDIRRIATSAASWDSRRRGSRASSAW